jgi:glycosyltransferase involved in cell wall biosynthesis
MKVLIATPLYPPDDGGPATYARLLETMLPSHGVPVSLVSFSDFRAKGKGFSHLAYLIALYRAANGVDLIYTLDLVSAGFPAMLVSFLLGKPLVLKMVGDYAWEQGTQRAGVKENLDEFVTLRSGYGWKVWLWRKLQLAVARHATKIVVPSHYLKRIIGLWEESEEGQRAIGDKTHVIYNAFKSDLPTASKEELRKELGIVGPTVISVGRFVPWKGFMRLMDAIDRSRKETEKDIVLEIAGSGVDAEYRTYAKEKGYDFVRFLGLLSHESLMKRIKAADCFALNTGYEGLSHVILEAMALGTPVVTTDVGGNTELFAAHRRNLLAHYNEIPQLSALISYTIIDPIGARKAAEESSRFVSNMTERRMMEETTALLLSVV